MLFCMLSKNIHTLWSEFRCFMKVIEGETYYIWSVRQNQKQMKEHVYTYISQSDTAGKMGLPFFVWTPFVG